MPDPATLIRLADCAFCGSPLRVHPPPEPGKVLVNCGCGEIYSIDFFPEAILQRDVRRRDDLEQVECLSCFHLFLRHDWSTKGCEVGGCRCVEFKPMEQKNGKDGYGRS